MPDDGVPPGLPPDPARLAARELARARDDARARGERPSGLPGPASAGGDGRADPAPGVDRPAPRRRAGRPRRDDPAPLRSAIDGLLGDQGWRTAAAVGSVFGRWETIVGPELAAHTRPDGLRDGELVVAADSTAWATQVRLLAATLVRRLNEELGDGAVTRVVVRGPAPPRRGGGWRVRGGRGARDDYG